MKTITNLVTTHLSLFQNESKCETFHMKMSSACSFIFMQTGKVIFIRMVSHVSFICVFPLFSYEFQVSKVNSVFARWISARFNQYGDLHSNYIFFESFSVITLLLRKELIGN